MRKWRVFKRDGAWQACDTTGFLRYASTSWAKTFAFALMGVDDRRRAGFFAPVHPRTFDADTTEEFREALRRALEQHREKDDE